MADLTTLNFDPAQTEDMGDCFKVLPPGHYNVVIVESAVNNTKAGNGKLLELKYQVIEGAHTGDTLTDRLNLVNPSELAQKIGLSQLKKTAIGIALLVVALFCWAHLGALLEIPGSWILRGVALAAAISTNCQGACFLWDALQARKQAREYQAELRARTIWPTR